MSEETKPDNSSTNTTSFKIKAGLFLASVAGAASIIGFGSTLAAAKKQDAGSFNKGVLGSIEMTETGTSLALRALKWGTIYAVGGCGVFFLAVWKLSGANNMEEFRNKMGNVLPKIPKNNPQGRTEFEGLTDLLNYISDEKSSKRK